MRIAGKQVRRRLNFPPPLRERIRRNLLGIANPPASLLAIADELRGPEPKQRAPRPYELKRHPNEPSEAQTLKAGLEYLRRHPAVATCWRQNAGSLIVGVQGHEHMVRFGPKGIADVIGYLKGGRFLAVEFKAPDGKLMPHQREFLEAVNAAGGLAFVARSIEDIRDALQQEARP